MFIKQLPTNTIKETIPFLQYLVYRLMNIEANGKELKRRKYKKINDK